VKPQFSKIVSNPSILNGKPCIAGTRISVDLILKWLASGANIDDIIRSYPHLDNEGVSQALLYAFHYLKNEVIIEVKAVA